LQHLHCSTGDAADQGGYAWNFHYSILHNVCVVDQWHIGGHGCTTKRGENGRPR
jgi:hypothetical protein